MIGMKTDNMKQPIEVAAAAIVADGKLLATQKGHGAFKGRWEFPGGKIEESESPEEAVLREIHEELDVNVRIDSYIETMEYSYPDFDIKLHLFVCSLVSGHIVLKEHESSRWLDVKDLYSLDWLPADRMALPGLEAYFRNQTIEAGAVMKAYTYIGIGNFKLLDKRVPHITNPKDAIVRVTLSSICTSDLHIKHGSVPRAVPGITLGHEMVGVVEQIGSGISHVRPGDRVTVNVETYCGECFFCKHGYVNNCEDLEGGWALGCRIDGGQTEYVRVPHADMGLNKIPDEVTDEQALFVGDILATGFWASRISEIKSDDTVLIIGAGPTGICTLICTMLKRPAKIIVCEKSEERISFLKKYYPDVIVVRPEDCKKNVMELSLHGGADVVIEVAGAEDTFRLAWECARPNAIVTIVALYDKPQVLPLPEMYGKNLTFKTGGVDGCDCDEILRLISAGKIDATLLITHRFPLNEIEKAYHIFENHLDGVIKVAVSGRSN